MVQPRPTISSLQRFIPTSWTARLIRRGYAGWLNFLNTGQLSRGDVLIGFSESVENHNAVDPTLVTGIVLDPHYLS